MSSNVKLIKELRHRTGAGFLDVKKALVATNNNIDKAIEWLQEKGVSKAAKKANAIAAEGVVSIVKNDTHLVIYEVNSQTDFVAGNVEFITLVEKIGQALLNGKFETIEEARSISHNGKTISEIVVDATAKIGEKIVFRRAKKIAKLEYTIGAYVHTNKQVAAIVVADGGTEESIRNVAMHVASMSPQYLNEATVPKKQIQKLKDEIKKSPMLENKPENIKENILKGMLRKALSELTLVDQEFVMEKMSVSKYLNSNNAVAKNMIRFEVGEGIEKEETDFAAEVAAQMNN